jgi:hypothetical protein
MFMSFDPTPTEKEALAEQRAQDAQYYRGILHGLIEMGNDIAGMIHQQAKSQAAAAAPDASAGLVPSPMTREAFEQIARTIRRCILLAMKVAEPAKAPAVDNAAPRRAAVRRQIIRRVEDSIHRDAPAAEQESLRAELGERLDAPEFQDDLDRPIEEVIHEIRADLGLLGPDSAKRWPRRTPKDIAILAARAAAPARERLRPVHAPMPREGRRDPDWRVERSDARAPPYPCGP